MFVSIIYSATAVATAVQLWWFMSWATWGAPLSPVEYFGLLGSVVLLVAVVLNPRKHGKVQFVVLFGLLLLWPFYALLMYGTWLTHNVSFTFKSAIVRSVPAAMLLGASILAGIQVST